MAPVENGIIGKVILQKKQLKSKPSLVDWSRSYTYCHGHAYERKRTLISDSVLDLA